MSFGSQTPELQNIAVKMLSQVTSADPVNVWLCTHEEVHPTQTGMRHSEEHCKSTLLFAAHWQYWTNRPQWCQHWVVFRWTHGLTLWH